MDNDASNQDKSEHKAPDKGSVSSSRRRLVLTTAPILLAVANRPAWANMCSISGAMSGPHSGTAVLECAGNTPGFWKAKPNNEWPSPFTWETTFNDAFGPTATTQLGIRGIGSESDITLYDLMWLQGNQDPYQAGAHMCAGILNAAYYVGGEYGYNVTQFQTLVKNALNHIYPTGINDLEGFKELLVLLNENRRGGLQ